MSEEMQYNEIMEEAPAVNPEAESHAGKALVWSILGLCFCVWGILGLIFSIIGKNNANRYEELAGELNAKARVGKILGTIGFIVSLVMTIIWGLFLLGVFIGILSAL